jgi:hypothetical protein
MSIGYNSHGTFLKNGIVLIRKFSDLMQLLHLL